MAPANGPYVAGTVISSAVVNARFADEEAELQDSLSRSGKGGMLASLRTPDGTVAAPAHAFTSEPASGLYKAGSGDLRLAVGGVDALKLVSGGVNGPLTLATGTTSVQVTVSGGFLLLQGNRVAADITLADVVADSSVTRTAGNLFGVRNNGTAKLLVDFQGLLSLASQAGPIQPAALWTAITPNANWTAVNGLAYWKDAGGVVHLKGGATSNGTGGAAAFNLPAGFRPTVGRVFILSDGTGAGIVKTTVSAAGDVGGSVVLANGSTLNVDPVSFLAEQ